MTEILIVAGVFALLAIAATLVPFFMGRGGLLAAAGTVNDPKRLAAMKEAIVVRYVKEEASFERGDLSRREWERRSAWLRHRYLDVARRLDFLAKAGSASLVAILSFIAFHVLPLPSGYAASSMVTIGPRHAIMLRDGVDQVWGHYVFTLHNSGKVAEEIVSPVMVPEGAVDIRPQEGITQEEVVVGEGGVLSIKKMVEPGVHLLSFGFVVSASKGHALLSFKVPYLLEELQVLSGRSSRLSVRGIGLSLRQERVWAIDTSLQPGSTFAFQVDGVVEGRQRLWILGATAGAVLAGMAGALALWTAKNERGKRDEEVLGV